MASNAAAPPQTGSSEAIRVCLRCRPFSDKEKSAGYSRVVSFPSPTSISIANSKTPEDVKQFTFDAVFDEASEQVAVYDATARGIVDSVLEGYNGTVFVYGQTGTGKTFTMQGEPEQPDLRGIIPQTFHHIFSHIARTPERQFLVRVSFLEIYNEEVRDLLAALGAKNQAPVDGAPPLGTPLELKEHPETGVYVRDLQAFPVKSVEDMDKFMAVGNRNRSVAATQMNAQSSRSHSIFTITIESSAPSAAADSGGAEGEESTQHIVAGKLHLVDLAGSERQSKTGASGDRLKEAAKINLSLSALGNCISALVDGKRGHVPYRDSKLTRLLQDSLGGNSKTLMIATVSPASYNFDESLSTLRYANRAKNIQNKPKVNEDPKDALLREYQLEIQRLQEMLTKRKTGGAVSAQPKPKSPTKKTERPAQSVATAKPAPTNGENGLVPEEDVASTLEGMDPSTLQQLQREIEEEKKYLLASKDIAADQKQQLVHALEARASQLEEERRAREQLASQLASLESKLLVGGRNIYDHVSAQELALEQARLERLEEENKQRAMQSRLELMVEGNMALEGEYASLQEEVDVKTRKLQKLRAKVDGVKQEMADLDAEWRNERTELAATVRELVRELELKNTILQLFVPGDERRKLEQRLIFDPDADDWAWLPSHLTLAPRSDSSGRKTGADDEDKNDYVADQGPADGVVNQMEGPSQDDEEEQILVVKRPTLRRPVASLCKRPVSSAAKQIMAASAAMGSAAPRAIASATTIRPVKHIRYCMDNILSVPLFGPTLPSGADSDGITSSSVRSARRSGGMALRSARSAVARS